MVLGIDPGYNIVGFAILEEKRGYHLRNCGVIRTDKSLSIFDRLVIIRKELLDLIGEYEIKHCAIERIYFSINKKSAIDVAQSRGVIIEAVRSKGISIYEYSPNQIKKAITGNGKADKQAIQTMVQKLLGLKEKIKQDDACDAVATAICHTQSYHLIKHIS